MTFRSAVRVVVLTVLVFGAGALLAGRAQASPVRPHLSILEQPNGASFVVTSWGDEFAHGFETREGFTVVQGKDGVWSYAESGNGKTLAASGVRPEQQGAPSATPRHVRPRDDRPAAAPATRRSPSGGGHTGTEKVLVILADFLNRSSVGTTAADWNARFFGASNSVKAFYDTASFGNLTLAPATETDGTANDGVVGFVHLNYNHPDPKANFGTNVQSLAKDAIAAADPSVNFASYDTNNDGRVSSRELHIVVILAGYETSYTGDFAPELCGPSVWGHNWSINSITPPSVDGKSVGGGGYSMFGEYHCDLIYDNPGHPATIGIMAHEFGHDIGFPDLYDIDLSSNGIGQWSIMSYGSWLDGGGYQGSLPALPDAFSKYYQGWITPDAITGTQNGVSIPQASTNGYAARLLDNPGGVDWSFDGSSGSGEYFLVENRQVSGLDAGLPGCGLLVWHVDESRSAMNDANSNDARRLVDLEEADGLDQLDSNASQGDGGDPYPGTSNNANFNNSSNPNSKLYGNAASGVSMHAVSTSCSSTMTADFVVQAPVPTIDIGDVSAKEKKSGLTPFVFHVTLSASSASAVTVHFQTFDGTAKVAKKDYDATTGTVTFNPTDTDETITVYVHGDKKRERSEKFSVTLDTASNATIGDGTGIGTIKNDDH